MNINKTEDVPSDCYFGASANRACGNRERSGSAQVGWVRVAGSLVHCERPHPGAGGNAASPKNLKCHHREWAAVLEVVSDRVPCNGRWLARTKEMQVD